MNGAVGTGKEEKTTPAWCGTVNTLATIPPSCYQGSLYEIEYY